MNKSKYMSLEQLERINGRVKKRINLVYHPLRHTLQSSRDLGDDGGGKVISLLLLYLQVNQDGRAEQELVELWFGGRDGGEGVIDVRDQALEGTREHQGLLLRQGGGLFGHAGRVLRLGQELHRVSHDGKGAKEIA